MVNIPLHTGDGAGRRERILDAAHKLFRSQGYEHTGTREIAVEAGVGEGTIFYHFGSKAGVLEALSRRFSSQLLESLSAGEPMEALAFPILIDRAFDYVHRFGLHHQQLGLPLDSPELTHFMIAENEIHLAFIRSVLEAHRLSGKLRQDVDIKAAAEILLAVLAHAILTVFAYGRRDEEAAFRREVNRVAAAFLLSST